MTMKTQMPFPIQSVQVRNFRGFIDGKLEDIGQVNVLVGRNNTGKTALLESILLLYGHPNFSLSTITLHRGWKFPSSLNYLVRSGSKELELQAVSKERSIRTEIKTIGSIRDSYFQILEDPHRQGRFLFGKTRILLRKNKRQVSLYEYQIAIDKDGNFARPFATSPGPRPERDVPVIFLESCLSTSELEDIYSGIVRKGQVKDLIKILKPVYEIDDLRLVKENGDYVLYVQIGRRVVPIYVCGDGFKWSFSVVSEILSMNRGIMLIDDMENFHHPSSLRDIIRTVIEIASKKRLQIFATTHSLECIDRFIEESEVSNTDFRLHFLRRLKDRVATTTYHLGDAKEARELIGLDLRGN